MTEQEIKDAHETRRGMLLVTAILERHEERMIRQGILKPEKRTIIVRAVAERGGKDERYKPE